MIVIPCKQGRDFFCFTIRGFKHVLHEFPHNSTQYIKYVYTKL